MALWSNTDANTSAPVFAVASGLGVSANGFTLYANTQADAFVTGLNVGVYPVSEKSYVDIGQLVEYKKTLKMLFDFDE